MELFALADGHQERLIAVAETSLSNGDHVSRVVLEEFAMYKRNRKDKCPRGPVAVLVRGDAKLIEFGVRLCIGNVQPCAVAFTRSKKENDPTSCVHCYQVRAVRKTTNSLES